MKLLLALLLVISAPAATLEDRVNKMAQHWKSVLALDDWNVTVRLVDLEELPSGAMALGTWDPALHTGRIDVLKPSEYKKLAEVSTMPELKGKAIVRDLEDSVLHELVHLRLREFANADEKHMHDAEEFTVVRLTAAFLKSRREP